MKTCLCRICKRFRKFNRVVKDLSPKGRAFMQEVLSELYNAEADLDQINCFDVPRHKVTAAAIECAMRSLRQIADMPKRQSILPRQIARSTIAFIESQLEQQEP